MPDDQERIARIQASLSRFKKPELPEPVEIPAYFAHGTGRTYDSGCRCNECKRYKSDVNKLQRARRLARIAAGDVPPGLVHGVASTYKNWGCRCEPCKDATRIEQRELKQRKRERMQ